MCRSSPASSSRPNALAVAPDITEAKVPTVIMNAATAVITTKSPYFARTSLTLPQTTEVFAKWAATKGGIKRVYTAVSDYGPGIDAETSFKLAFTAAGGTVVDSVRFPLMNPDFAPFLQRVLDKKPQALYAFIPGGSQPAAFVKTFHDLGLDKAHIRLLPSAGGGRRGGLAEPAGFRRRHDHRHALYRGSTNPRSTRISSPPGTRPTVRTTTPISSRSAPMTAWR